MSAEARVLTSPVHERDGQTGSIGKANTSSVFPQRGDAGGQVEPALANCAARSSSAADARSNSARRPPIPGRSRRAAGGTGTLRQRARSSVRTSGWNWAARRRRRRNETPRRCRQATRPAGPHRGKFEAVAVPSEDVETSRQPVEEGIFSGGVREKDAVNTRLRATRSNVCAQRAREQLAAEARTKIGQPAADGVARPTAGLVADPRRGVDAAAEAKCCVERQRVEQPPSREEHLVVDPGVGEHIREPTEPRLWLVLKNGYGNVHKRAVTRPLCGSDVDLSAPRAAGGPRRHEG